MKTVLVLGSLVCYCTDGVMPSASDREIVAGADVVATGVTQIRSN